MDSFYVILGDDDFLVHQKSKELFNKLAENFPDDLSRELIDGRAERVEEVESLVREVKTAGQTLSLFGAGKLIWVNQVNFLNQTKTGSAMGTKEALETLKCFFLGLGDTKLILSACPIHRGNSFVKWLQKNSVYEDVSKKEKEELAFRRTVELTAENLGIRFGRGALEYLAAKIGPHTRLGVEETKKLASFLGDQGGEITDNMIMEMVPDFGEGDFFEASEAFFSGKIQWAMDAIDRHFFHGKDARPLLATLQNRNRLLIQLRVLSEGGELSTQGRLGKEQLESIGRKYAHHFEDFSEKTTLNLFSQNPWFLSRLLSLLDKFSARRLIDLQSDLIRAFQDVLIQPKEQHAKIFKHLAIRANTLS